MKSPLLLLSLLSLAAWPVSAQQVVVPAAPAQPGVVVIEPARPTGRPSDTVIIHGRLSTPPKAVPVPQRTTVVRTAPAPAPVPTETVKTTRTTTTVEAPGQPVRVYNSERSVVIVEDQGQARELPYVTVPVLFVKSTAELLDAESRAALTQVAGMILEVRKTDPAALFDIEGHTSTEGTDDFNMNLSAARAQRVYDELTQRYGVPPGALTAHGYGENYPSFPDGTEEQMQQDRRVLVVRTK